MHACAHTHTHTHTHSLIQTLPQTQEKKTEGASFFGTALSMIIHNYVSKIACLAQETQMVRRKILLSSSL